MAKPVRMPSLGQTSDELRISSWKKSPGEPVVEGESLLEIETDKTNLEVESSSSGVLLAVLFTAGDVVEAGTVIAWVGEPGEEPPNAGTEQPPNAAGQSDTGLPMPDKPVFAPREEIVTDGRKPRLPASPAARALARQLGVDISSVVGSGPGGRIEKQDVAGARTDGAPDGLARVHVPPHRVDLARRLSRSAQVPQFAISRTVDATRAKLRLAEVPGATYTHLLLKALGSALKDHPQLNRVWSDDGPSFDLSAAGNVGLAVADDDRLNVITIPNPDRLGLAEVAALTREMVSSVRAGQMKAEFLAPAAVTLTNLGMFGVDQFTPLLEPGRSAVLGAGRAYERPVVTAQGIIAQLQIDLTLTVDHRTADGAAAAEFLLSVVSEVER